MCSDQTQPNFIEPNPQTEFEMWFTNALYVKQQTYMYAVGLNMFFFVTLPSYHWQYSPTILHIIHIQPTVP